MRRYSVKSPIILILLVLLVIATVPTAQSQSGTGTFIDPKPAIVGTNQGSLTGTDDVFYYIFNSSGLWYDLQLTGPEGAIFAIRLSAYEGNGQDAYLDSGYNSKMGTAWGYIGNYSQSVQIAIRSVYGSGNFELQISPMKTPSNFDKSVAQPLTIGVNTGEIFGAHLTSWFEWNTTVDSWFSLSLDAAADSQISYMIYYPPFGIQATGGYPLTRTFGGYNATASVAVVSDKGAANFTISLSNAQPAYHYSQETAKTAVIGDNEGEFIHPYSQFWFVFSATARVNYKFYLKDEATDMTFRWIYWEHHARYDEERYLFHNYGDVIIEMSTINEDFGIRITNKESTGTFNLTIEISQAPPEIVSVKFSDQFNAGDIFDWDTTGNSTGVYQNDLFYGQIAYPLSPGATTEVSIKENSIPITYDNWRNGEFFDFKVVNENTTLNVDYENFRDMFLRPIEYTLSNGTVLSLVDFMNVLAKRLNNYNVSVQGGNLILDSSHRKTIIDIYTGLLKSESSSFENSLGSSSYLVQISTEIPSPPPSKTGKFPVPIMKVPLVFMVLTLLVIKRKKQLCRIP